MPLLKVAKDLRFVAAKIVEASTSMAIHVGKGTTSTLTLQVSYHRDSCPGGRCSSASRILTSKDGSCGDT